MLALNITQSGIYYEPKLVSETDLMLMRLIDEIHLGKPFLGIHRIKDALEEALQRYGKPEIFINKVRH